MLYDYIITNYQKDEPIFLAELPGKSRESVRQEMKKLTDEGKIVRLYNGVYYRSYKTILGTKGKVSVEKFIQKRYLEADGKRVNAKSIMGMMTMALKTGETMVVEATGADEEAAIEGIEKYISGQEA